MPALPWRTFTEVSPDAEVVVMASRLPLRSHRSTPGFIRDTQRVMKQLGSAEGLVGYSLLARLPAKTFFTLSAWRNETDLRAFHLALPHADVMKRLRVQMEPTTFTYWKVAGSALPVSWDEAFERLAAVDRDRTAST
jgi:heme-degrading monooxygenase HmoA